MKNPNPALTPSPLLLTHSSHPAASPHSIRCHGPFSPVRACGKTARESVEEVTVAPFWWSLKTTTVETKTQGVMTRDAAGAAAILVCARPSWHGGALEHAVAEALRCTGQRPKVHDGGCRDGPVRGCAQRCRSCTRRVHTAQAAS
jgi:hypothetical protein